MSKEILLDFNTIFWVTIDLKKNYGYVTRLKSRIYKAVMNKVYNKIQNLQIKLFYSLSARLLAMDQISKKQVCLFKYMSDLEKLFLIQTIDRINTFAIRLDDKFFCFFTQKEILTKELNVIITDIDKILLSFILEPQWILYYQNNKINFLTLKYPQDLLKLFQMDLINLSLQKIYFINVNYKDFMSQISNNYFLARIHLKKTMYLKLKMILLKNLFVKFASKFNDQIFFASNSLVQFPLEICVLRIIIYCLCLETYLIAKSYNADFNLLYVDQYNVKIYQCGLELLICNYNYSVLKFWFNLFLQLVYSNISKNNKLLFNTITKTSNSLDFCGYSILVTKNKIIYLLPNKLSQFILLFQIKHLLNNLCGNSATNLIKSLNPLLEKWASYFKDTNAFKVFMLIDYLIYLKLWVWTCKNHTNWSYQKIRVKYFHVINNYFIVKKYSGWIFHSINVKDINARYIFLIKLTWFISSSYIY
jgi:hypothetical protein